MKAISHINSPVLKELMTLLCSLLSWTKQDASTKQKKKKGHEGDAKSVEHRSAEGIYYRGFKKKISNNHDQWRNAKMFHLVLSLRQLAWSLDGSGLEFGSDSQKETILSNGFKGVNYQSSQEPSAFPDWPALWGWGGTHRISSGWRATPAAPTWRPSMTVPSRPCSSSCSRSGRWRNRHRSGENVQHG